MGANISVKNALSLTMNLRFDVLHAKLTFLFVK